MLDVLTYFYMSTLPDFDSSLIATSELTSLHPHLLPAVMRRIQRARKVRAFYALLSFLPLLALSALAWRSLQLDLESTGFTDYVSLILSDFQAVLVHWQEFVFSLLESAPVVSIASVFAVLLGWLLAIRFLVIYGSSLFSSSKLLSLHSYKS